MTDEANIIKFFHGECSKEELEALEESIAQDDNEARALFELRRLDRTLRTQHISRDEVEQAYARWEAMHTPLTVSESDDEVPRSRYYMRWAVAAAVALLLVVAGVLVQRHHTSESLLVAKAGKRSMVRLSLPDGTSVWLRQGATLRYPAHFTAKAQREVELEGEAYFEVTHSTHQPFVVHGQQVDVRVLGTKFNVVSGDTASTVSLLEGRVQVSHPQTQSRLLLVPGQTAHYDGKAGDFIVSQSTDTQLSAVWHDGQIPFHNASLSDIAHALEALYDVHVTLRLGVDTTATYTGSVERKPTVEQTLEALAHTLPIAYKVEGRKVHVWQK